MAQLTPCPPTNPYHGASSPTQSPPVPLLPTKKKHTAKSAKLFRTVRNALRSFPIIPSPCRLHIQDNFLHGMARTTGTLFGCRKARITLAIQDNPRSIPLLMIELGVQTAKFMQEMSLGLQRIALECEKKPGSKTRLLNEPLWTAFINGRKIGYAATRDPTESDLSIMQMLHAVSVGAGVLPEDQTDVVDGELTYMRAYFNHVVGNRDSETFYMVNPDSDRGPELSIFFVRI